MLLKEDGSRTLVARPTPVRVLGAACIIFFLFCGVMSWGVGPVWGTLMFFGFVLVGVYLLLVGSVEMDARHVTYRTPLGTHRIGWDEVLRIETDAQGGSIVFWGEGKRLNTIGPEYWSEKGRVEMLLFLRKQVQQYGIKVIVTPKAMFRLTKNTKVSR